MVKILRENNSEIKQMSLDCLKGATLLSVDEVENLLTKEERKCRGLRKAIINGLPVQPDGYGSYWLRDEGEYREVACRIGTNGGLDVGSVHLKYGIRPALILNLQSSNLNVGDRFKFGEYTFKVISNDLALCDVIIDACPFNEKSSYGNNYRASYVKDKVDRWFRDLECKECNTETDDEIFTGKNGGWVGW